MHKLGRRQEVSICSWIAFVHLTGQLHRRIRASRLQPRVTTGCARGRPSPSINPFTASTRADITTIGSRPGRPSPAMIVASMVSDRSVWCALGDPAANRSFQRRDRVCAPHRARRLRRAGECCRRERPVAPGRGDRVRRARRRETLRSMDVGKPKKVHEVEPVEDPVPKEQPQEPPKERPAEAPSQPVEGPAR